MKKILGSLADSGLGWSAIGTVGLQVGRLVLLLVLTQLLPTESFGTLALVQTFVSFSSFFADAGASNVFFRPELPDRRERATLLWAGVLASGFLALILLIVSKLIADWYQLPVLRPALSLAAMGLIATSLGIQHRILFRRVLRFRTLALVDLGGLAVQAAVALGLARQGYGVFAVVWGSLAGQLANTLLCWVAGPRAWLPGWHFDAAILRQHMSFSLFQLGERSLNFLAERSDVLLIGKLLGPGPLGIYDVLKQLLARPEALVNPAVCQVTLPLMAARRDDADFVKKTYLDSLRLMSALNFPIYAACFVLAEPLLTAFLGGPWAENADIFRILAAFYLLHSTFNPIGSLQMAKGRADLGFYWNAALFLVLPLVVWLGAAGGLTGVASALLIVWGLSYAPFFRFFLRPLLPCLRWQEYAKPFLKPLFCAATSAAVVSPLLFWDIGLWPTLILGTLAGAAIYFSLWRRVPDFQ